MTFRFVPGQRRSISTFCLVALPVVTMAIGVAMDLTSLNAQAREMQARSDLAALSAIRNFDSAETLRQAALETLSVPDLYRMRPAGDSDLVLGYLDADHNFTPSADQDDLAGANAVRVTAASYPRLFALMPWLDEETLSVRRSATAALDPRVSFSLSNCLLSLDLLNGILRPIVGADLDLLCAGHGLRLDGLSLLEEIALRAKVLEPGQTTFGDILDARIDTGHVLGAVFDRSLPTGLGPVQLGQLLYVDEKLRRTVVGNPIDEIEINAADIVFGSVELLYRNVAGVSLGIDMGPVAGANVGLQIGEARRVVMGAPPGDPEAVARTAQIRLRIAGVSLVNLVTLDLDVELARAEATLSNEANPCSTLKDSVVARFSPATAELLATRISLGLPLLGSLSLGTTQFGNPPVAPQVDFTRAEYTAGTVKTVQPPSGPASELAEDIDAVTLGLVLPLGLTRPVTAALDAVLTDVLGLTLAEAELSVIDLSCKGRLAS